MSFKRISVRQGWRVYGMDARCDCTSTVLCKETKRQGWGGTVYKMVSGCGYARVIF